MSMSTWDYFQQIFLVLGGLSLFLFGLKMMSDGLKSIAGNRMRTIIGKATANRFLGFLVGMIVTAVIQSSTATSVMAIGFINAGLMKLSQFVGIIIGANVGSTFTAFLISFRIDPFAPLLISAGIVLYLFNKKKKIKDIGFIILGFGMLFFGLSTMSAPLGGFARMDGFQGVLAAFQNPILALLAGLVFTAIIQSSAATIGIIIALYYGGVNISFDVAVFLVLGSNVGTCSTALLSAIASNRESKRAALTHLVYNVITCAVFGLVLAAFPEILVWFQRIWQEGARQVVMFHALYNVAAASIMIFFTKQLTMLIYLMLPKRAEEDKDESLLFLGTDQKQTPSKIFEQANSEINRMGKMAYENLQLAMEAFYQRDADLAAKVFETEDTIDYLKKEITGYLTSIHSTELSSADIELLGQYLQVVSDIERIGDHAENIAEHVMGEDNYRIYISMEGFDELLTLSDYVLEALGIALQIFETRDSSRVFRVDELENRVDSLSEQYLKNHISRLSEGACDPRGSVIFSSIISDLERCSDHAMNIAEYPK